MKIVTAFEELSPHEAYSGELSNSPPLDIYIVEEVMKTFSNSDCFTVENFYKAMLSYNKLFAEKEHQRILSQGKSIAVDLDGTIAMYVEYKGPETIGAPVDVMIDKIKEKLKEGKTVKIFTARANPYAPEFTNALKAVQEYIEASVGQSLEVTSMKDMMMEEIWDDRAKQIIPNTGLEVAPSGLK